MNGCMKQTQRIKKHVVAQWSWLNLLQTDADAVNPQWVLCYSATMPLAKTIWVLDESQLA